MVVPILVGSVLSPLPTATAGDRPRDAVEGVADLINGVRSADGVPGLRVDADLASKAQRWADSLSQRGVLEHSSDLGAVLDLGLVRVGENVGRSNESLAAIIEGFETSAQHRRNDHDPGWTDMGLGVSGGGTMQYVVVLFGERRSNPAGPATSSSVPGSAVSATAVAVQSAPPVPNAAATRPSASASPRPALSTAAGHRRRTAAVSA